MHAHNGIILYIQFCFTRPDDIGADGHAVLIPETTEN